MEYTTVYMDAETNKLMLSGETAKGWLEANEDDMEIIVGNYRITPLRYPYVYVKPASN